MGEKLNQAINKIREACQYLLATESRVSVEKIAQKAGIENVLALACVHWLQVNEPGLARIVADIYCPLKPDTFIIRRYKIEEIVLDSKIDDIYNLLN